MAITICNQNGNTSNAMLLTHSELVKAMKQCDLINIRELKHHNDNQELQYLRTVQKIVQLAYKYNPKVKINSHGIITTQERSKLSITLQIVNSLNDINTPQHTDYKSIASNSLILAKKLGIDVSLM